MMPEHETLKREMMDKFQDNISYVGKHIRTTILHTDFKSLKGIQKPNKIKKGDVIISFEGVKKRPCVIFKVKKDGTCLYIPLTSTDNLHCLSNFSSRFFGEGCFTKSFSVCSEEFAIDNFAGIFDNIKDLNLAVKELKKFITENI